MMVCKVREVQVGTTKFKCFKYVMTKQIRKYQYDSIIKYCLYLQHL